MRNSEKYATTDGRTPEVDGPTPTEETLADGQYKSHWILTKEERSKGFIRPVRTSYKHVGVRPTYSLRALTPHEQEVHSEMNYQYYEEYPPEKLPLIGHYWTEEALNSGCGGVTTMPYDIAETWAADPHFYGSTFCARCHKYLPVEEFVWNGTNERLGS